MRTRRSILHNILFIKYIHIEAFLPFTQEEQREEHFSPRDDA